MSNPFYVPRNNNRMQNFLGLASLATQLYGLKQKGDIAETESGLKTREIEETGRIADQKNAADVDRTRVLEMGSKTERMKIPYHQQNFGYGDAWQMKAALSEFGLNPKDETNPVIQRINELAKSDNVAKVDAWQAFRQDPEMKQPILEAMEKKMESGMAKNPDFLTTKEGQGLYAAMQAITTEEGWSKAVDGAFRNTVRSVKQMEAAAQAKAAEDQSKAFKDEHMMTDQGVVNLRTGQLIQNTGKLVKPGENFKAVGRDLVDVSGAAPKLVHRAPVDRAPERPVSVPEGGTLVDPRTGKQIFTAQKTAKELTPSEKRLQEKDIRETETKILTNKTKEEAAPLVESFNENATAPHFYKWQKGKLYGGEWVKTPLPKIKGKQVTAKDVYDTAAQRGMTYEEVLAAIGVK